MITVSICNITFQAYVLEKLSQGFFKVTANFGFTSIALTPIISKNFLQIILVLLPLQVVFINSIIQPYKF